MRQTSMVRIVAVAAVAVLAACANDDSITQPQDASPVFAADRVDGLQDRYIVVFRDDVANPDALTDQLTFGTGAQIQYRYRAAIKGFAAVIPPAALQGIQRNPNVMLVEPDGIVTTTTTQNNATWGLDRIDQRNLPLNSTYIYDANGSGVSVYIIDTGIRYTHNEFNGRASFGYDALGGDGSDCHGHGTHVAGTVGGTVYGVAKNVDLYAVRVLSCSGSGSTSGVIAGVDWVRANAAKPAVANMSLGGGASTALDNAVASAVASGVTFAVAAGNSNANACNYSPARTSSALTVGSTTSSDTRSSFSNYGSCVDVFAPGSSITSAWRNSNTSTNTISGTSMASPHVAGVAALYLSMSGNSGKSPSQVATALLGNATQGVVGNAGSGSPNLLLHSLFGSTPTPNNPPTAAFTYSCTYLSCTFDASSSMDGDGTIVNYAWTFGDGSGASGEQVGHTYTSAGSRQVTLTVTDDDNASDSESKTVTVNAPPSSGPQIASYSVSTTSSGPNWEATVTVQVLDGGGPVSNTRVDGSFDSGATTFCMTDTAGVCSLRSGDLRKRDSITVLTITQLGNSPYNGLNKSITVTR